MIQSTSTCSNCSGTGQVNTYKCDNCGNAVVTLVKVSTSGGSKDACSSDCAKLLSDVLIQQMVAPEGG